MRRTTVRSSGSSGEACDAFGRATDAVFRGGTHATPITDADAASALAMPSADEDSSSTLTASGDVPSEDRGTSVHGWRQHPCANAAMPECSCSCLWSCPWSSWACWQRPSLAILRAMPPSWSMQRTSPETPESTIVRMNQEMLTIFAAVISTDIAQNKSTSHPVLSIYSFHMWLLRGAMRPGSAEQDIASAAADVLILRGRNAKLETGSNA